MSLKVLIKPTHDCNMACRYCYVSAKAENGRMDEKTLENSIKKIASFNGKNKPSCFIWHGGEPLLMGLNFLKKVIEIQKESEREGYKFRNGIQTNGTLINEEAADFFKKHDIHPGLSLDGPEKLNDKTRVYKNGKSTFKDVLNAIYLLKERNISVGIIITLNKKNISKMPQIYHFLEKNKLNAKLNPLIKSGRAEKNYDELSITPGEYKKAKIDIFNMWFNNDKTQIHLDCFEDMLKSILQDYPHGCHFSNSCQEDFISIGPKGDVYPCGRFDGINEFRYGNINEGAVEEILAHPLRERLLKRAKVIKDNCSDCDYQKLCNGGCMHNAYAFWGDVMKKDPYCIAYKGLFKHLSDIIQKEIKIAEAENGKSRKRIG